MQLFAPEIVAEAREFSPGLNVMVLAMGLVLWLLGWRGHRFWIVLAATAGAGIVGLANGAAFGTQPLIAGLLLAVAAGALALALVRVVVFAAGGFAAWAMIRAVTPGWHEPLISFLVGGLAGLLLFRVWTMLLTSFAGTVLMTYSSLSLADGLGKLDAIAMSESNPGLLNWCCAGVTLIGLAGQILLERWMMRRAERQATEQQAEWAVRQFAAREVESRRRSWWNWGQRNFRKAG